MQELGAYGAQEVLHVNNAMFDAFSAKAFAKAIKMAVKRDLEKMILPSTKGRL